MTGNGIFQGIEMRRFIRHPASIPIEISICAGDNAAPAHERRPALDVSLGGLAFHFFEALEPGALIIVRIRLVRPVFETVARVAWCGPNPPGFKVGAAFLHAQDEFRARMVEQVCHIENYRQQVFDVEHRPLTIEEAAVEWIAKFATQFPDSGTEEVR